jgi:UDP-N-acetylmuramate dehydrogenase
LAPYTTLKVGGEARWFVRANNVDDVASAHRWCAAQGLPLTVLGAGSNVVVADDVADGLILHMAAQGFHIADKEDQCIAEAAAGIPWTTVVDALVQRGFAGVECLAGIPGSVGGTPIQNIGAYGQEIANVIERVVTFDRSKGRVAELGPEECGFGYRMSRFRSDRTGRFIVCGVSYRLRLGLPTVTYPDVDRELETVGISSPTVADVRRAVLAIRKQKGMVTNPEDPNTRSVGSFFVNPVVTGREHARLQALFGIMPATAQPNGYIKLSAAWLIERSGFERGFRTGSVGLSTKHPLAIVTLDGATACDVVDLAVRIKRRVSKLFDVSLRAEPIFVGFGPNEDVEYLRQTY